MLITVAESPRFIIHLAIYHHPITSPSFSLLLFPQSLFPTSLPSPTLNLFLFVFVLPFSWPFKLGEMDDRSGKMAMTFASGRSVDHTQSLPPFREVRKT